nr:integrase, catalytic region, zinc finger, CCHC-type, peptidase aspartic, catalytic [Tanacetum cinerariifolium]
MNTRMLGMLWKFKEYETLGGQDNTIDNDVDEQHVQDLALNVDNVFQAEECDAFDSDVDEAPTAQTMFMANLSYADPVTDEVEPSYDSDILSEVQDHDHYQDAICAHHEEHTMHDNVQLNHDVDSHADHTSDSNMIPYDQLTEGERGFEQTKECYLKEVIPFFKTLKENFEGIQKALTKEIKEIKYIFEELEVEVAQNVVDRKHDAIERKNLLIENDNLIAECLSKEVFFVATNSELNVARFTVMHVANTIVEARCLELEAELANLLEEAKVVRPLDRSIVSTCHYTKHSQELLEYAIGTCPQDSQQRDKQLAHIPLIRKNQVTFAKPSEKSNSNTHKHVAKVNTQKTNVLVPPSTGVNSCFNASGSQPRSNTKRNRISPAKGVNKLPVEDQPRTNKSHLRTSNRVDSSSRLKRIVINLNSDSVCQTCNKCLISSNHDMCVVNYFQFVVAPHLFVIIVMLCEK